MTKSNEAKPTQVRDIKSSPDKEAPQKKEIQIHSGNTAVLTVQFLNQINEKLFKILNHLEKKDG